MLTSLWLIGRPGLQSDETILTLTSAADDTGLTRTLASQAEECGRAK